MICDTCIHNKPWPSNTSFPDPIMCCEIQPQPLGTTSECDEYTPKLNLKNRGLAPMNLTGISLKNWFKS